MANSSFINPVGEVPNWIHPRSLDRTLEGAAGPIRRPLMKPLALMQDSEGWVFQGTGQSSLNNDADFIFGHQSLKLYASASSTAEMYRVSVDLHPSIQSIRGQIGIWIKVDSTANLSYALLAIYPTADWGQAYWNAAITPQLFGVQDNEWLYVSLSRDNFNGNNISNSEDVVDGPWSTANPTCSVGLIRIILVANSAGSCTMKVGGIVAEDPPVGSLVMGFDDAFVAHYETAFITWQPLGLKGTMFAPMALVDGGGRLTGTQLKEMSDAGWEIGHHGYSHTIFTTSTSHADVWKDISDEKRAMADLGIPSPLAAAWPGNAGLCDGNDMGDISDTMFLMTRYRTQRTRYTSQDNTPDGARALAGWTRTDLANLPASDIGAGWSSAISALDRAVAHRMVLSTFVHDIQPTPQTGDLSTANWSDFTAAVMQRVAAGTLEVLTYSEWYNRVWGRQGIWNITGAPYIMSAKPPGAGMI